MIVHFSTNEIQIKRINEYQKHEINKGDPPLYSQLITLTISRTALEDIEKIIYFDIQCNKIQMLMIYKECNFPMTPPVRRMVG